VPGSFFFLPNRVCLRGGSWDTRDDGGDGGDGDAVDKVVSLSQMAVVYSFNAKEGQSVKANLVRQSEVLLVDDENYEKRKLGLDYKAVGGHFTSSPALIPVPRPGLWHLVIEDHQKDETSASLIG
jgi:hypothetical protein